MSLQQEKSFSYRGIFKATSLFGGVQLYQILISVIKSKFIALLIGTEGVGILGLYQIVVQFVQSLTALGLSSSAVRDVSEANASGDVRKISKVVIILKKLVWFTGCFGLLVVCVLSSFISKITFGNNDYTLPFIFLSVVLLLDQLTVGQNAILQGTRQLRYLAKSTVLGSTLGLLISIPIYYIWGIKGIVPTLILNSLMMFFLSFYFSKKVKTQKIRISLNETLKGGVGMIKMGIVMSFTSMIVYGSSYVLRGYIRFLDDIETVGLFTAGFTMLTSYVGMVFTAMSTDYYPRLAAVNSDNAKCMSVVNKQGEIALFLLSPLLIAGILFMPLIIQLLYSSSFLPACDYVIYAAIGVYFKLTSWLLAFQFIAKGESKIFMINELIANIYMLLLNMAFYKLASLKGLGISFTLSYFIYFLQVYVICKLKYKFQFSIIFIKMFVVQFLLTLLCFVVISFLHGIVKFVLGIGILLISLIFSWRALDRCLALKSYLKTLITK